MYKTACVYHSVDLDGWMSAAIVRHWMESQPENIKKPYHEKGMYPFDYIGYNYGQPIPDLSQYARVYMCDISFPKEEMQKLHEILGHRFFWIDHHVSAIKENNPQIEGLRDTKYSACELTFKYFYEGQEMPEIIRLLGRYDCFGHKGTDEEQQVLEFQYGARQSIANYEDAYESLVLSIDNKNYILNILNSGATIYKYLCTEAKQAYKNGFKIRLKEITDIDGSFIFRNFICINKERFNPINFGIKYHEDNYDGCACFHYANDKWHFSIYNDNGKVDCSAIAKSLGGGGHKGASGFMVENINAFFEQTII